jgi:hypothetical protein
MKKILLAFDGTNFSEAVFEFVRKLNEAAPVFAVGVFLPQVDYANSWSYAAAASAGMGVPYIPLIEDEESEAIQKNIERFEELCQTNGIAYRVHKDVFDLALPELKKESRFADIVILGGEIFYRGVPESTQFDYLRDALHSMESPVLIVPEHYHFPDNNVLAYDGSEESVYAMKQFAYIFPELAVNPTVLVWAESEDKEFPSRPQITELITQHYQDLSFISWISFQKSSSAFGLTVKKQPF